MHVKKLDEISLEFPSWLLLFLLALLAIYIRVTCYDANHYINTWDLLDGMEVFVCVRQPTSNCKNVGGKILVFLLLAQSHISSLAHTRRWDGNCIPQSQCYIRVSSQHLFQVFFCIERENIIKVCKISMWMPRKDHFTMSDFNGLCHVNIENDKSR